MLNAHVHMKPDFCISVYIATGSQPMRVETEQISNNFVGGVIGPNAHVTSTPPPLLSPSDPATGWHPASGGLAGPPDD